MRPFGFLYEPEAVRGTPEFEFVFGGVALIGDFEEVGLPDVGCADIDGDGFGINFFDTAEADAVSVQGGVSVIDAVTEFLYGAIGLVLLRQEGDGGFGVIVDDSANVALNRALRGVGGICGLLLIDESGECDGKDDEEDNARDNSDEDAR